MLQRTLASVHQAEFSVWFNSIDVWQIPLKRCQCSTSGTWNWTRIWSLCKAVYCPRRKFVLLMTRTCSITQIGVCVTATKLILMPFQYFRKEADDKADWTHHLRSMKVYHSIPLTRWMVVAASRCMQDAHNFVRNLQQVGRGMDFSIADPKYVVLKIIIIRFLLLTVSLILLDSSSDIAKCQMIVHQHMADNWMNVHIWIRDSFFVW